MNPEIVSACFVTEVVLFFLSAGPEPSDTASTTARLWEGFSHRSVTFTWSITSGVRSSHTDRQNLDHYYHTDSVVAQHSQFS